MHDRPFEQDKPQIVCFLLNDANPVDLPSVGKGGRVSLLLGTKRDHALG